MDVTSLSDELVVNTPYIDSNLQPVKFISSELLVPLVFLHLLGNYLLKPRGYRV